MFSFCLWIVNDVARSDLRCFCVLRSNLMLPETRVGPDLHRWNCGSKVSHAHQIVGSASESEYPVHSAHPAVTYLAHRGNCLQPARKKCGGCQGHLVGDFVFKTFQCSAIHDHGGDQSRCARAPYRCLKPHLRLPQRCEAASHGYGIDGCSCRQRRRGRQQ